MFGIFPCCSGPVSLFVSIFASDTFYQDLATRTAEECRVSSCLPIFEIVFCRTSCFPCSSHNLCTGMCSHHLLCSRFRCILCKRAFVSHTVHGFLLYASAMSLYGTAACIHHNDAFLRCTGRAASSQRRCDRCLFFVVAPALRCSFRGIVQLVAS